MLDELHIENVALIRQATFAPAEGLTVVTGETGAGKTALLNALKLLVGERADAGLVREGADELRVEGRFFLEGGCDEGLVAQRRVSAQGRSRAQIDGSLASVRELSATVGPHVDLCGQHEHQRLLSPAYQAELLDAWGADDIAAPLAEYRACLKAARDAQAELDRLHELEASDMVELDRARFALDQIAEVDPQPGEYEELLERMPRLEHAEQLVRDAVAAQQALSGAGGALERMNEALASLDRIAGIDGARAGEASAVREAYYQLEDVGRTLASYRDQVDFPQAELEAAQERLSQMQGLMRGFGPRMEDVFALQGRAQTMLAEYEGLGAALEAAQATRQQAEEALTAAAAELCAAREDVAPRFAEAVCAQMGRLEMGTARVEAHLVGLPRNEWGEWGPQAFELLFSPGEHMAAQPLRRIASGGEMSRVMLALKVALGAVDEVDTLVFDEIDAGVGGATALALGAVLEDLARTHQVIVVTHLPQVAVRGNVHYRVSKTGGVDPETTLRLLGTEERVDEIARMLAGEVNETSRAHARELLRK